MIQNSLLHVDDADPVEQTQCIWRNIKAYIVGFKLPVNGIFSSRMESQGRGDGGGGGGGFSYRKGFFPLEIHSFKRSSKFLKSYSNYGGTFQVYLTLNRLLTNFLCNSRCLVSSQLMA